MKFNGQVCYFNDNPLFFEPHIPISESIFKKFNNTF